MFVTAEDCTNVHNGNLCISSTYVTPGEYVKSAWSCNNNYYKRDYVYNEYGWGRLVETLVEIEGDMYCDHTIRSEFQGDSAYTVQQCAEYCGKIIYNRGSYEVGDNFTHYVTNRRGGDSMKCFCHYPERTETISTGFNILTDVIKVQTEVISTPLPTAYTPEAVTSQTVYHSSIGSHYSPAKFNIVDGIIPSGLSEYKGCSQNLRISKTRPTEFVPITCSDIRYSAFDKHNAVIHDHETTIERKYTEELAISDNGVCNITTATPTNIMSGHVDTQDRSIEHFARYGHCEGTMGSMGDVKLTETVNGFDVGCPTGWNPILTLAECRAYLGEVEEIDDATLPSGCGDKVFNVNDANPEGYQTCWKMEYDEMELACSRECVADQGFSIQWDDSEPRSAGRVGNRRFECRCGTPTSELDCVMGNKEWISNIYLNQYTHESESNTASREFTYVDKYLYCPTGPCSKGHVAENCKGCPSGSWYDDGCISEGEKSFCKNGFVEEECMCKQTTCEPGFYCTKDGECMQVVRKDKKMLQVRYKKLTE